MPTTRTFLLGLLGFSLLAAGAAWAMAHGTADALRPWLADLLGKRVAGRFFTQTNLLIGTMLVAVPLQIWIPAVKRRPKLLTREVLTDLLYWYQSMGLQLLSFYVALKAANGFVWPSSGIWIPAVATLPFAVQVILALWLKDFVVYWRHRAEHRFLPLWAFHAVHHSTKHVDPLTTARLHPMELFWGGILAVVVTKIGFNAEAAALAMTIYLSCNLFIHMNIKIRMPGFLKYVFVSPFMHQWHHAVDPATIAKNTGVVFAWNDWLFGSIYHPDHWPTSFGIDAPPEEQIPPANVLAHLVYPVKLLRARARAALARRAAAASVPAE